MTDTDLDVASWAQAFIDQNMSGADFRAPWTETPSLEQAYAVQDRVFDGLAPARGDVGGYKVAVTAKPMQDAMGLTAPLGGLIHGGQVRETGCALSASAFHSPALEFEVTVRLGRDVPLADVAYDRTTIEPFVAEVMASYEVVDPRGAELAAVGAVGLVADRCLSEGAVLGPPCTDWSELDLSSCAVEVIRNGEVTDEGVTGAAMGHPFEGLAWVANHMGARGRILTAGQVVLTGSAFAPMPVIAGDEVTYRIAGLGEVSVSITD